MSEANQYICPECHNTQGLVFANELPADNPVQAKRPIAPKVPAASLGCIPVVLVSLGALIAAALIGGLVQLNTPVTTTPNGDLRVGDSGTFSGILVFMVVFVALFSILVWRQTRNDRLLQNRMIIWRAATERYEALLYCPACQRVFAPGTSQSVPIGQAELLLYQ
jgi:hypothetical protein